MMITEDVIGTNLSFAPEGRLDTAAASDRVKELNARLDLLVEETLGMIKAV